MSLSSLLLQTPLGPPCGVAAVAGLEGVADGTVELVGVRGVTDSAEDDGGGVEEVNVASEADTPAADEGAAWGDVAPLLHAAASTDKAVPSNATVVVDLIVMRLTFVQYRPVLQ